MYRVPVLWVMLVLTALTAVHRFVRVYRQAAHPPRVHTGGVRRLLSRDETLTDRWTRAPMKNMC